MRNTLRPVVCFGSRQWEVRQSQTGDGGLHAVGQSPGAAVPWEPRAHMAEELETKTRRGWRTSRVGAIRKQREALFAEWTSVNPTVLLTVHFATSRLSNVRMRKKNLTSANAAKSAWIIRGSHICRAKQNSMSETKWLYDLYICTDLYTLENIWTCQEMNWVVVNEV